MSFQIGDAEMRIGISLKWTLSSILLVIMVVLAYTYIMRNDTEESVTQETARIQGIQNNALDGLGAQTTKTVSLPAMAMSGTPGVLSWRFMTETVRTSRRNTGSCPLRRKN